MPQKTAPAQANAITAPAARLAPSRDAPPRWMAPLLGVLLFAVYLSNLRVLAAADSIPTRVLPFSILRGGDLNLDEFSWLWSEHLPYYVRYSGGHIYSGTTIGLPIALLPIYVLPNWFLRAYDISYDDVRARVLFVVMERVCAAALTTIAAVVLFHVLSRLVRWRWALGLTLIYALGCNTWVIASQALWPHTLIGLILVLLSALFVSTTVSRAQLIVAGVLTAFMVVERPQTVGIALLIAAFVWRHHRRHVLFFAALPLLGAVAVLAYNLRIFHNLAGAYVTFDHFSTPLLTGLGGLLLSPNRGLFVYSPIMLFAIVGAVQVWRQPVPAWIQWMVFALVWHLLLYGMFDEWWAGYTYGPRYMTEMLPILTLLLVYGMVPLCRSPLVVAIVVVIALYGVAVQALGVYWDDDSWNREPLPLERAPQRIWDWHDWQVARAAHGPWRGGELGPLLRTVFRDAEPVHVVALEQDDLASTIDLASPLSRLPAGASTRIAARIRNNGSRPWPVFTADQRVRDTVFLIAQWYRDGTRVSGDVLRLPRNVIPGSTIDMDVPLHAPPQPGAYELELLVTQARDGSHGIASADHLRVPVQIE